MTRSIEFGSRKNYESSKNPENTHPLEISISFEDHMRKFRELMTSLNEAPVTESISEETAQKEAELAKIRAKLDALYSDFPNSNTQKESTHRIIRDLDQPKNIEGREFHLSPKKPEPTPKPEPEYNHEPISQPQPESQPEPEYNPESTPISTANYNFFEKALDVASTPESSQEAQKINADVKTAIFENSENIEAILGENQYANWQNIVNRDIESNKYQNAIYEDDLIYYIGNVNETSRDTREDWDVMKYRTREQKEHYDAELKSIDPQVKKELDRKIYLLGVTLGDNSVEYHDALNKINQDIDSGHYRYAQIHKNPETGENQLIFTESQKSPQNTPEESQPEPIPETSAEPKTESQPDLQPEPSVEHEPTFTEEMSDIIKFEVRTSVDTLKTIYSKLNTATKEQQDRFNYLYRSLSETSKRKVSSKEEEQKKYDDVIAYSKLINRLAEELEK